MNKRPGRWIQALFIALCFWTLACSGVGQIAGSIPSEWNSALFLMDDAPPYLVLNTETGAGIDWNPETTETVQEVLGQARFYDDGRIIAYFGKSYDLQLGDEWRYFTLLDSGDLFFWEEGSRPPENGEWIRGLHRKSLVDGGASEKVGEFYLVGPNFLGNGRVCYPIGPIEKRWFLQEKLMCLDLTKKTPKPTLRYQHPTPDLFHVSWNTQDGVVFTDAKNGVYVLPPSEKTPVQIAQVNGLSEGDGVYSHWSPDGQKLLLKVREGRRFKISLWDGQGELQELAVLQDGGAVCDWSPDSTQFAYVVNSGCKKDHRRRKRVCDREYRIWDLRTSQSRKLLDGDFRSDSLPRCRWVARPENQLKRE